MNHSNWAQEGGEKFQKNNICRILKNPIYRHCQIQNFTYKEQRQAIISDDLFSSVRAILAENNVTMSEYRAGNYLFYLKGLLHCAACHSVMTPSFALSKGKKYFYYRCTANNDRSKKPCRIGSINAKQVGGLVIVELKFLGKDTRIIEGVVESATKDQRARAEELTAKKKTLQNELILLDK